MAEVSERKIIDDKILRKVQKTKSSLLVLINKIDTSNQENLEKDVLYWSEIFPKAEIIPISALKGFFIDELRDKLKTAKGKDKENIKLALEEKFRDVPGLVEDSGIDIYTGKPMEIVDVEKVSEIVPDTEINVPGGALSASRKRRTFQDKFNEILSESGLKDKKGKPLEMETDPIKRNEQITSLV